MGQGDESGCPTKSGFMLGLGETWDEIIEVMHDLREHKVDILTIGQYLRPSFHHLPIQRYIPLEEFATLKEEGKKMGFRHVASGPFVPAHIMPTNKPMALQLCKNKHSK